MLYDDIFVLSTKQKKFFIEKIDLIIDMVTKYIYRNHPDIFKNFLAFEIEKQDNIIVVSKLLEMGIIKNTQELKHLKLLLKSRYSLLHKSLYYYECLNLKFLNKFSNTYRHELQQKEKEKKYNLIDLFAGAGGFSLGFLQEGFKVELANDIDDTALETYKFNHPEISSDRIIKKDIKELVNEINNFACSEIDVIIGGPPCQSFSTANQRRIIDDPRNVLYKYFVDVVNLVRPKMILMENVRGMLKVADQVVQDFKKIGYDVAYDLFDATDFSVPQKRIRLFYIGIEKKFAKKHSIKVENVIKEINKELQKNPKFVLKDALSNIKPLECAKIKNMTEKDCEHSGKKVDINTYGTNEYLNIINNHKSNIFVFNHKARYTNENDRQIYSLLKQGEDSTAKSIQHIMPYKHRNHIFKDKYFKLVENLPSRTITAHLKMDGHSHIHPTQIRSITPREAARIQSFPDDYLFLGPYLNTFMQIGNAVPPLMSRVFARVYKKLLHKGN
ncbi:DNA cytosine methyltransferase [Caminibacter pacificus]|uniref:Cytosine-specific methyltransferase n=1 Tax=Caminibacter pacificus TaxID=1424653 RepID=A0AAJ4RD50_9BACT|nr:DNA cytosine methyltransferase [Caminibacter pacificus]QCI27607.1 DNA cytosine methyltransferase [Caminibacter pacificus]ROR40214.1 DNA (cytosine-5)-methyltransferase 1 [Caminibacter pacificus]